MAKKPDSGRARTYSITAAEGQRQKKPKSLLRKIKDSLGFGSKSKVKKIVPQRYNAHRYTENPTPLDSPIDNDTQSIQEAVLWGHVRPKRPFSWYREQFGSKWVAANHLGADRDQREFEKKLFYTTRVPRYHTHLERPIYRAQYQTETDISDQEQPPAVQDEGNWYPSPWQSHSEDHNKWAQLSNASTETLIEDTDFMSMKKPVRLGTRTSRSSIERIKNRDWLDQSSHAEARTHYFNTDDFRTTGQSGLKRRNAQAKRPRKNQPQAPKHAFTKPRQERSPAPSPAPSSQPRLVERYLENLPSPPQAYHPSHRRRRKSYKPKRPMPWIQDPPPPVMKTPPNQGRVIDDDESPAEWLPRSTQFYNTSTLPEPPSRVTKYGYPQRKAIR